MKLIESNHETSERVYVCPFCLKNIEKGVRCVCNEPGTIRTPEQTVQSRIERLTENNRQKILMIVQLLEDREAKHKQVESEDIADQTTPPATTSQTTDPVDSVTWRNSFAMMRCLIALNEYTQIDSAIGALQAVHERIDENDFQTRSMIDCIDAYLQAVYETLQDRRDSAVKAFNRCYPSEAIGE